MASTISGSLSADITSLPSNREWTFLTKLLTERPFDLQGWDLCRRHQVADVRVEVVIASDEGPMAPSGFKSAREATIETTIRGDLPVLTGSEGQDRCPRTTLSAPWRA